MIQMVTFDRISLNFTKFFKINVFLMVIKSRMVEFSILHRGEHGPGRAGPEMAAPVGP